MPKAQLTLTCRLANAFNFYLIVEYCNVQAWSLQYDFQWLVLSDNYSVGDVANMTFSVELSAS